MKKKLGATILGLVLILISFPSNVLSQNGIVSIDRISNHYYGNDVLTNNNMRIVIRFQNNTGAKLNISNGFKISTPDGAIWDSVTIDTLGYQNGGVSQFASYFDDNSGIGLWYNKTGFNPNVVGVLAHGFPVNPTKQLPINYNDTVLAIVVWNLRMNSYPANICIDSSFFGVGGKWIWVGSNPITDYYPEFTCLVGDGNHVPYRGYCFEVYDLPCAQSDVRNATNTATTAARDGCNGCCEGANGDLDDIVGVDVGDLSVLIDYLMGVGNEPPCINEANIDNIGVVDISDLTALISYLSGGVWKLQPCL